MVCHCMVRVCLYHWTVSILGSGVMSARLSSYPSTHRAPGTKCLLHVGRSDWLPGPVLAHRDGSSIPPSSPTFVSIY